MAYLIASIRRENTYIKIPASSSRYFFLASLYNIFNFKTYCTATVLPQEILALLIKVALEADAFPLKL